MILLNELKEEMLDELNKHKNTKLNMFELKKDLKSIIDNKLVARVNDLESNRR